MDDDLQADRALLDRLSTAEKVADILRTRIIQGYFRPGHRLIETSIGGALGVSRNTLREAFRLLGHERLLVQELNRGVFVRVPSIDDLVDIFRVRRIVEPDAVRRIDRDGVWDPKLERLADILAAAQRAQADGDWQHVGTADIDFHAGLTALAGSRRIDEMMRRLFAELRLVFHLMPDARRLHEPYLARNLELFELVRAGDGPAAERYLVTYLDDSERTLITAYEQQRAAS